MSLSNRLRAAEEQRRRATGSGGAPAADDPVIDLSSADGPQLDLTRPAGSSPLGDASFAFAGPVPLGADRLPHRACPRCGGATQVDLLDQVHQTVSLSCTSCFHMFRVELES